MTEAPASNALSALAACLCAFAEAPPPASCAATANQGAPIDEKPMLVAPPYAFSRPAARDPAAVAAHVIALIDGAEKRTTALKRDINHVLTDDFVYTDGAAINWDLREWKARVARAVLDATESALRNGREKMGPALADAYDKTSEAAHVAFQLAKDHPLVTAGLLTILAIGVLVFFTPIVVEALGFAELGPVEGSFAAWWESTYAGSIPAGSLFSFFQRLGMVWGKA